MKTILLIATLLITSSALVQAGIKDTASVTPEVKARPDDFLIININQLRSKTEDISLLKPVFMIIDAIENATSKLHGRKIKICCNKSSDQSD